MDSGYLTFRERAHWSSARRGRSDHIIHARRKQPQAQLMTEWRLDLGVTGKPREAVLTAHTPFNEILRRIRGRDSPPPPQKKFGNPGGLFEGAYRAVWTITPRDREALDLFFNGSNAYRAAYSRGLRDGEEANTVALTYFCPWLRDWAGMPVDQSSIPLLGIGGKLWIPENERVNRALITGCVAVPEVLVTAWLEAAKNQIAVKTSGGLRFKAAAGVLAPLPAALKVIGPWIRDGVIVDTYVKDRGTEIHLYGYT